MLGIGNWNGEPVTHIVGQADEVDAIRRQQDVALGELTALPRRLVLKQSLDAHQPRPLLARIHSASHTETQATAALQEAYLGRRFCNTQTGTRSLIRQLRSGTSETLKKVRTSEK